MDDASARQLMAKIAAGCDTSLAALYDRFAARLYRTALALAGRSADAEDAVAEVFLSLSRRSANLSTVERPAAYLTAAVRNAVRRQIARREKDRTAVEAMFHLQAESAKPTSADDDERLRDALGRLPDPQREVIALKIYAELTFAEIADLLEVSSNTAASRYRYALEKLREMLNSGQ